MNNAPAFDEVIDDDGNSINTQGYNVCGRRRSLKMVTSRGTREMTGMLGAVGVEGVERVDAATREVSARVEGG
jgi:hypothetical protein